MYFVSLHMELIFFISTALARDFFRYTLLVGRPPFETSTLKDTYSRIRKGEYLVPPGKVSAAAKNLISKMLQVDPALRPTAKQVLNHEFLTKGMSTTIIIVSENFIPFF